MSYDAMMDYGAPEDPIPPHVDLCVCGSLMLLDLEDDNGGDWCPRCHHAAQSAPTDIGRLVEAYTAAVREGRAPC